MSTELVCSECGDDERLRCWHPPKWPGMCRILCIGCYMVMT